MISAVVLTVSVSSVPMKRDVDPALVPDFGHAAGVNPTGTGDCDGAVNGANGQPVKVPCTCPPDKNSFIQVRIITDFPTQLFIQPHMYDRV